MIAASSCRRSRVLRGAKSWCSSREQPAFISDNIPTLDKFARISGLTKTVRPPEGHRDDELDWILVFFQGSSELLGGISSSKIEWNVSLHLEALLHILLKAQNPMSL
jgi:hypothetical protein